MANILREEAFDEDAAGRSKTARERRREVPLIAGTVREADDRGASRRRARIVEVRR